MRVIDEQALRSLIEEERTRFGVPGLSIVVVADGEVVIADGFGVCGVDTGQAVTGSTLFPIASDTKCFTAALLTILSDEGSLDLDVPVREILPWFRMHDQVATELVTARDLLCHRTGLPRHDLVWYGPDVDLSNEEIARLLRHLQPSKPLRQVFQYNNLCYITAGHLAEHLLGVSWPEAVQGRILDPLGMKSTIFSAAEASHAGDFAWPHNDRTGTAERVAQQPRREAGPAGGIVSNAEDLSRWVLARLGLPVDGARPLSDAALRELHAPTMIGGPGLAEWSERAPMGYALGCTVESYRGHRVIRHGGNLLGYSSDVCVAPNARAAVVALTNLNGTGARDAIALMVLDRLLGLDPAPWGERFHELTTAIKQGAREAVGHHVRTAGGRPATRPLAEYTGRYEHPAYGIFAVSVDGDRLVPNFHGIAELTLEHRDLDVWDARLESFDQALPVVFHAGADGSIEQLSVPLEPTVEPIVFRRAIDLPSREQLGRLAGEYAMGPLTVSVSVHPKRQTLVVALPMAGRVTLEPRSGLSFAVPGYSGLRVEFEVGDDGAPTRLIVEPVGVFTRAPASE